MTTTSRDREAFQSFVEQLRRETFSMYEGLREVQRSCDDEMEARLQRLGQVGSTAADIFGQIEQLYAAVWHAPEAEMTADLEREASRELAFAR
jgi:hypothetical protein